MCLRPRTATYQHHSLARGAEILSFGLQIFPNINFLEPLQCYLSVDILVGSLSENHLMAKMPPKDAATGKTSTPSRRTTHTQSNPIHEAEQRQQAIYQELQYLVQTQGWWKGVTTFGTARSFKVPAGIRVSHFLIIQGHYFDIHWA